MHMKREIFISQVLGFDREQFREYLYRNINKKRKLIKLFDVVPKFDSSKNKEYEIKSSRPRI